MLATRFLKDLSYFEQKSFESGKTSDSSADSDVIRGINAAMEGVIIDSIEFFRVPFFEKDRSNIIDMVRAHHTRSIELSSECADTDNLGPFFTSLADAGVKNIKLKAMKNEPFLGKPNAFWEESTLEWSRASPFEFTINLIVGSIIDILFVKVTRRRSITYF